MIGENKKIKREDILCELLKCEVLCANCHIIAHREMEDGES